MNQDLTGSTNWRNLFAQRNFWLSYIITGGGSGDYLLTYYDISHHQLDEMEDTEGSVAVPIPLVAGYELRIEIALYGGYERLLLVNREGLMDERELELGWDDGSFAYSALRWEEMLAITRCYEMQIVAPFPSIYLPLLLKKFTPTSEYDDREQIVTTLATLWEQTGLFNSLESAEIADQISFIQQDLHWVYDEDHGWVARGFDAYSLRYYGPKWPDSPPDESCVWDGFDHVTLRQFFSAIDQCAGTTVSQP